MAQTAFALFETAIGTCGVAWGQGGLIGVQLPEGGVFGVRARMTRRYPQAAESAPPDAAAYAIRSMTALLDGEPRHLREIALDLSCLGPFEASVYDLARAIDPGSVLTYGEIAARLGEPAAARAVGQALGRNPWPIIVPCHRVLGADGKVGGFSAPGGAETKLRMLTIERAQTSGEPSLFGDLPLAARPRPARS